VLRVCHVCSGHLVDDGRVFQRACASLAKAGYDVHLIATGKNQRNGQYREQEVTVHPLPAEGRLRRIARRGRVARLAASLKPDLFHVHEPELLAPVVRVAGNRPVIWDVHESYLDVLTQRDWIPRPLRPTVRLLWDLKERRLLRKCAGVVAVTDRVAARYRKLHPRVVVVSNYPNLDAFQGLAEASRDGRTCVFAGMIAPDRGLFEVITALGLLKQRGVAVPLALAGPCPSEYMAVLLAEARRLGVGELVTYHGVLSKTEAISFQNRASIGLVTYLPVANSMASMANKLSECMALGLPVIYSDFPNYREVAGESGAGIAVDPTNPEQIALALARLIDAPDEARKMGEAGRRAVARTFNWSTQFAGMLQLYRKVLPPPEGCLPLAAGSRSLS
jgi:glycosyltransferase involved in cell wall biosynthesis